MGVHIWSTHQHVLFSAAVWSSKTLNRLLTTLPLYCFKVPKLKKSGFFSCKILPENVLNSHWFSCSWIDVKTRSEEIG